MSCGLELAHSFRTAAANINRIIEGWKTGQLTRTEATKFYLAVNLNTAKALGLTIPKTLLTTADELIE